MTEDIASAARRIMGIAETHAANWRSQIYEADIEAIASTYLQLREKNDALVKALREAVAALDLIAQKIAPTNQLLASGLFAKADELRGALTAHGADDDR